MSELELVTIKKAQDELDSLCSGKRKFTMSIPVQHTDTDIVIGTAFRVAETAITERDQLRAQVEQAREVLRELVDQVERSAYGESSLHTWDCPAPDHGRCNCNAEATVDAARAALAGKAGK